MIKRNHVNKLLSISVAAIMLLIPFVAFASTAATGSITGAKFGFFGDIFTISDGVTSYSFLYRNSNGDANGQCALNNGFTYYEQPCLEGDDTVVDNGGPGGSDAATMTTRAAAAINATAIGVTATANDTVVDLVNDTVGAAGNVAITETAANESFVVTGMSGGDDSAPVPEFSTYLYMMTLAAGAWYVINHFRGENQLYRRN